MASIDLSVHTQEMLAERNIPEAWVWQTIAAPDQTWRGNDDNFHYAKAIAARHNRVLHVIVDDEKTPHRVVTVFFDRRLKR